MTLPREGGKESPNKRGDKGLDPGATVPPLVIERPTQVPRYQEPTPRPVPVPE